MTRHFVADVAALLGRSLRHVGRSPDTIITTAITPIAMMLLFVYVFGGAIETAERAATSTTSSPASCSSPSPRGSPTPPTVSSST